MGGGGRGRGEEEERSGEGVRVASSSSSPFERGGVREESLFFPLFLFRGKGFPGFHWSRIREEGGKGTFPKVFHPLCT